MYISIGHGCNVKQQINTIKGSKETLFFDWLMTDMKSVNQILSYYQNIDELLYFDNIIQCDKHPYHQNNSRMLIKSLSHCVSIHDINKEYNEKDIEDFIDKYKRRFLRILDCIKSNDKLYFIRYGNITNEEKEDFIKIIKEINHPCNFILISIKINQDENLTKREDNYIEINIQKPNKPYPDDWKTSFLDWENIFKIIDEI